MPDRTKKQSVSMPSELAEAVRARTGPTGFSAYVTTAVARQLQRDQLREILQAGESQTGPVTDADLDRVRSMVAAAHRSADVA